MLNWRSTLPAVEDAGEYAMDQLLSAANSAAKSAREVSSQIESWAADGYESIRDAAKSEPAFWGAMTVGMGALIGGLYALWRNSGKQPRRRRNRSRSGRTMAASSGIGSAISRSTRSMGAAKAMVAAKAPRKSTAKKRSIRRKKTA